MCLEMVLDTNVLVHASNTPPDLTKIYPKESAYFHWCDASLFVETFINKIRDEAKKVAICVDDTWNIMDQGENESQIVHEYWKHVLRGTPDKLGKSLLITLAKKGLILSKSKWPNQNDKKIIEEKIQSNITDRIFIGVTCSTNLKTLISNDEDDFPKLLRVLLHNELGIDIHLSDEQGTINGKYFI